MTDQEAEEIAQKIVDKCYFVESEYGYEVLNSPDHLVDTIKEALLKAANKDTQ